MSSDWAEKLQYLKTHLTLIKTMKDQQADNQFFTLMEKAKNSLGDTHPQMAFFYFEYANYLMTKMQQNMDIFNAGALPKQQQDGLDQIKECYEQLSQNQDDSAKSQNIQNQKQQEFKGQNFVISQDKEQNFAQDSNQKVQPDANQINEQPQQKSQGENQSDIQICYQHLECALKIYLDQKARYQSGQKTYLEVEMIERLISRVRARLGDLYMMDEHYPEAVDTYRTVISDNQKKQGHQSNRILAQIHYLIGNAYLYQNKQCCEKVSIIQYIKAINILVKNLEVQNNYDTSSFQMPTVQKLKVDRFAYLIKPNDSEVVKQIKDIINILLDKIEDTAAQLNQKEKYQQEKKKIEQDNKNNVFKEVDKNVKVTSLGVFGNRKKTGEANPTDTSNSKKDAQITMQKIGASKDQKSTAISYISQKKDQDQKNNPQIVQEKL